MQGLKLWNIRHRTITLEPYSGNGKGLQFCDDYISKQTKENVYFWRIQDKKG